MTDEEKPIVAVESSQPGEPARPPSKWTGRRIVAVAVTLTTLLGGVWTVIQLSEWTFYRPNEEKLEAGWRRVQLQGGGSIAMPQSSGTSSRNRRCLPKVACVDSTKAFWTSWKVGLELKIL